MTPRVQKLMDQLPHDIKRDIIAVAGGCKIGDRGICERCNLVEKEAHRLGHTLNAV